MDFQHENALLARLRRKGHIIVDETPKLDLEAYISNYRGRTRYDRLYLIGTSSSYLSIEALKAAIAEAKRGDDVGRYEQAVSALAEAAPTDGDATPEIEWIERTRKKVKVETDKMETELKGYKNNLIKESIRMGYQDLGKQYQRIGDLANSTKSFSKMYDHMTASSHMVTMCMHLIHVAIDQRNWYSVTMNAQRVGANGTTKWEEAKKQSAKLSSSLALADLASCEYKKAAEGFINTDPSMTQAKLDDPLDEEAFNEVLTPNDIAVYGGLCALASFSRSELQSKVLEHKTFRNYLELEPHIRRAISFFISSKYSSCLSILQGWRADYLLDIYLQPCFLEILEKVRRKAIHQYFVPFSCVTLETLAHAFTTDVSTIELELTQMIKRGDLDARIDPVDRLLLAPQAETRGKVHEQAMATAKDYGRIAHLRVLRMAMLNAGLEVKPTRDRPAPGTMPVEPMFNGHNSGDLEGVGSGRFS